ncbi:VOC family protein [Paludibaculum fermentans]|uniref:VOC family protein n=1 Tax=Paludibaculum fermentans TaxID=1473598 RepID=A0A7S7NYZ2_PALFE|nr:VOC family protein [Paludibaculum fermentans]QOY92312.1 VOC family protein [Paludibaculum fermentans]
MAEPRLHHVGYIVDDVAQALPHWVASLEARWVSEIFHDPLQKVSVVFLQPAEDGVQVELVAPAGPDSPVAPFLAKGGGLHHLCYEVDLLEPQIEAMKRRKAVVIRPPKPAVAFGGRRIAWMVTRERLVLEYVERRLPESAA